MRAGPAFVVVVVAALAACTFDTGGADTGGLGGATDGGPTADGEPGDDGGAPPDAAPLCVAGASSCDGATVQVCNADGTGFASELDCPFTCVEGACVDGSNLTDAEFELCDGEAPALAPVGGALLHQLTADPASARIACGAHCGDGVTTAIAATAVVDVNGGMDGGEAAVFCLASLTIPDGSALVAALDPELGPVEPAVVLVVHGDATIAGEIDVSGGAGSVDFFEPSGLAGVGGPGAADGAPLQTENNGPGLPGAGPRGGSGGEASNDQQDTAAGGGGGGGYLGAGGAGGTGVNAPGDETADGGAGGAAANGTAALRPLIGGSGGGGGADSQCEGACGFPGGGGGGALQISAGGMISVSGEISASGGDGFGTATYVFAGGGGGGSGGAVLLEARVVSVTGAIVVDGGRGGRSGAGLGGAGAATVAVDGSPGASASDANRAGGAGGGGGAGRIRINAIAPSCSGASPTAACSTGAL